MNALYWLPELEDLRPRLQSLSQCPSEAWREAMALANAQIDFIQTNMLDATLKQALAGVPAEKKGGAPVRLAVLGSCTTTHLQAAIRVGGLRRGVPIEIYENAYGQYWQELIDPTSRLHAFDPTFVLFTFDARHLAAGVSANMDGAAAVRALRDLQGRVQECWRLARDNFRCPIIQQTALPAFPQLLGANEHRLPGSRARFLARFNEELRGSADANGVDLLALDSRLQQDGRDAWHDAALWHRSKQEIRPSAAPMYGDLVARIIAAKKGRSCKCLVMDLDNTIWGGVVGDDGVDGLVLGQGSALGEAYVAFQDYALELSRRGIILAVSSKNDERNALEVFERHPEMVLKREHIACFAANWSNKADNLRSIAKQLNIGLDSLVFIDDNPFERNLVRQALPMVAVPEVPDDPTAFPQIIADAGYFEGLAVTDDDRARGAQYQENLQRETLRFAAADLQSYLQGLNMTLEWRPFDQTGLARTVQLINKTNQFNLTTRRYAEDDVVAVMRDRSAFGLQLRLLDRFGDNGVISVIIGRMRDSDLVIDVWLMSCRVLGREVEKATLNIVAEQARTLGALRLIGDFLPTPKNAMVKDHYAKLGFSLISVDESGATRSVLDLNDFTPAETNIKILEVEPA